MIDVINEEIKFIRNYIEIIQNSQNISSLDILKQTLLISDI